MSSHPTMLPAVQHQVVSLVVNPAKGRLRGWTEITALAPDSSQAQLALHTQGHLISSVLVNGLPAQFELRPEPLPSLAAYDSAPRNMHALAERAYYDHLEAVHKEVLPELTITLPDGWFERAQQAALELKQQQQAAQQQQQLAAQQQQPPKHKSALQKTKQCTPDPVVSVPNGAAVGEEEALPSGALNQSSVGGDKRETEGLIPLPTVEIVDRPLPDPLQPATVKMEGVDGVGAVAEAKARGEGLDGVAGSQAQAGVSVGGAVGLASKTGSTPAAVDVGIPLVVIRVTFSRPLDATTTSALMLLPGDDAPDCEHYRPGSAQAVDRYLVSSPQLRRTRALFPCVDMLGVLATYDVRVTVPPGHVAVCDGVLLGRTVMMAVEPGTDQESPHSVTWYFKSEAPVNASHLVLATGPLATLPLPQPQGKAGAPPCVVTLFAPHESVDLVGSTTRALPIILRVFEKSLHGHGTVGLPRWPWAHLQLAFLPAAAFRGGPPLVVGSNTILASTALLVGPDACESAVASTLALVGGIARCIYGGFVSPNGPEDQWIVEGLAGHLEEMFTGQWLGKNELAWRRHHAQQALALADSGALPPLCPRRPLNDIFATGYNPTCAYGYPLGSELFEPGPFRSWKARAVLCMLERRAGEDTFKRLSTTLVHRAMRNPTSVKTRVISTARFMENKILGIQGMEAFAQRWIHGRGCPEFELGVLYRKNNVLDLVLRQGGSAACFRGALQAAAAARAPAPKGSKSKSSEDEAQVSIKVGVYEAEGQGDTHIRVAGLESMLSSAYQMLTKVATHRKQTKRKGKDGATKEDGDGPEVELPTPEPSAPLGPRPIPMWWARLDPNQEWLGRITVRQPEVSWIAQLQRSKDVVAQSQAVEGLARYASFAGGQTAGQQGPVNALWTCATTRTVFCRVRAEAMLALALPEATADLVLPLLAEYLHRALHDPVTLALRPNSFADLAEYTVLSAVVLAMGMLLGSDDRTPQEAVDALVGYMDACDNTGNLYSDAHFIAVVVEALGRMRPGSPRQLAALLTALDRRLALEDLNPSPGCVVGVACLNSLQRLSARMTSGMETRPAVRDTLARYACPGGGGGLGAAVLRHAAARALMAHDVASVYYNKGTALVQCILALYRAPGWGAAGRAALLTDALEVWGLMLATLSDDDLEQKDTPKELHCDVEAALPLYREVLHEAGGDARTRHLAFALMRRMAGQSTTLYIERLDDEEAFNERKLFEILGGAPAMPTRSIGAPGGSAGTVGTTLGGIAAAAQAAAGGGTKLKMRVPQASVSRMAAASQGAPGSSGAQPTWSVGGLRTISPGPLSYSPAQPAPSGTTTGGPRRGLSAPLFSKRRPAASGLSGATGATGGVTVSEVSSGGVGGPGGQLQGEVVQPMASQTQPPVSMNAGQPPPVTVAGAQGDSSLVRRAPRPASATVDAPLPSATPTAKAATVSAAAAKGGAQQQGLVLTPGPSAGRGGPGQSGEMGGPRRSPPRDPRQVAASAWQAAHLNPTLPTSLPLPLPLARLQPQTQALPQPLAQTRPQLSAQPLSQPLLQTLPQPLTQPLTHARPQERAQLSAQPQALPQPSSLSQPLPQRQPVAAWANVSGLPAPGLQHLPAALASASSGPKGSGLGARVGVEAGMRPAPDGSQGATPVATPPTGGSKFRLKIKPAGTPPVTITGPPIAATAQVGRPAAAAAPSQARWPAAGAGAAKPSGWQIPDIAPMSVQAQQSVAYSQAPMGAQQQANGQAPMVAQQVMPGGTVPGVGAPAAPTKFKIKFKPAAPAAANKDGQDEGQGHKKQRRV